MKETLKLIASGHIPTLVDRQIAEINRLVNSGVYKTSKKSINSWNNFVLDRTSKKLDTAMNNLIADGNKKSDMLIKLMVSLKQNLSKLDSEGTSPGDSAISNFDRNKASSAAIMLKRIIPELSSIESTLSEFMYTDDCRCIESIRHRLEEICDEMSQKAAG